MGLMIRKEKKTHSAIFLLQYWKLWCYRERFQLYFTLGVNYTMPHSNGINEPADEKDVSGETDERSDGSVGCSYTDLPQISAV